MPYKDNNKWYYISSIIIITYRDNDNNDSKNINVHSIICRYCEREQLLAQKLSIRAQSGSVLSKIEVIEEQIKTLSIEKQRVENLLKENAATQKQLDDISGQINILKQFANRFRSDTSLKYMTVFER